MSSKDIVYHPPAIVPKLNRINKGLNLQICNPMHLRYDPSPFTVEVFHLFLEESKGFIQAKGLKNFGQSCFLNSMLQCLFALPVFRSTICREETYTEGKIFWGKLRSLFKEMQSSKSRHVIPQLLAEGVDSDIGILIKEANDVHECMIKLLHCLSEDYTKMTALPNNTKGVSNRYICE